MPINTRTHGLRRQAFVQGVSVARIGRCAVKEVYLAPVCGKNLVPSSWIFLPSGHRKSQDARHSRPGVGAQWARSAVPLAGHIHLSFLVKLLL